MKILPVKSLRTGKNTYINKWLNKPEVGWGWANTDIYSFSCRRAQADSICPQKSRSTWGTPRHQTRAQELPRDMGHVVGLYSSTQQLAGVRPFNDIRCLGAGFQVTYINETLTEIWPFKRKPVVSLRGSFRIILIVH